MFNCVSRFAANIRNSPAFFGERRKELMFMCEQLGDPHVFATNSYADTFCPYLMRYISPSTETWTTSAPGTPGIRSLVGLARRRNIPVGRSSFANTHMCVLRSSH